ncbi:MAG: hypothetical protein OEM60_03465, partial [Gammaproteobacteria bacterium]|nr:hypothetical protein [Gammaproteobacteria bacterium]
MRLSVRNSALIKFLGAALALPFLLPAAAFAQQSGADRELEEITVTARKRVEKVQGLALSVSAMGAKEIQNN